MRVHQMSSGTLELRVKWASERLWVSDGLIVLNVGLFLFWWWHERYVIKYPQKLDEFFWEYPRPPSEKDCHC